MTMTAVNRLFVDANVLVYANVTSAPYYAVAQQALIDGRNAGIELVTSRQILREYAATVSRVQTFMAPVSAAAVAADLERFQAEFTIVEDSAAVMANLLNLLTTIHLGGRQVHDANIVATMMAYGIPELLTHNTVDFTRFGHLITVVPLVP